MLYDELLDETESLGLRVKEKSLNYGFKGIYKNGKIIIDNKILTNEKACILAEEMGHHVKTSGNIIDQNDIRNVKQEKIARNWAYEKLISPFDLIRAFENGIRSKNELIEYLNVTEKFLEESITHYKEKFGIYLEIDDYIIYFEPALLIMKRF